MKGTLVRKRSEGYGFIKPEEGDKDLFFHASSIVDVAFDDLNENDIVSFEVEEGPKGPSATNVQLVSRASEEGAEEEAAEQAAPVEEEAPAESTEEEPVA